MKCCNENGRKLWLWSCSGFILLLALLLGLLWPMLSLSILYKQFELRVDTLNYRNWIETPIPMYAEFYLFNWTNHAEVLANKSIKPHLVEMGPYVFEEHHKRVDVEFFANDTVAFNQTRTWHFKPERSNGTLDDMVTNLNTIALTVAYNVRNEPAYMELIANSMLRFTHENLVITKTVAELLFDGYSDPVLTLLRALKLKNIKVPFAKFGWFVERNGSSAYDGRFHMNTGTTDIHSLGMLQLWQGANRTEAYRGHCGDISGTTGELWPPVADNGQQRPLTMFLGDICRSLSLTYAGEESKYGVSGQKYVGDASVFDNGWNYPEMACYCTGDSCPDLLPGAMNVSECKFGAPALISFPHFYLADPNYGSKVEGLEPDKAKHAMHILMNRATGIPLEVRAPIQLNLMLQAYPKIDILQGMPSISMPMFWFRQVADITEELARDAWWASKVPELGVWFAYGLAAFALLLVIAGAVLTYTNKWTCSGNNDADDDDELLDQR